MGAIILEKQEVVLSDPGANVDYPKSEPAIAMAHNVAERPDEPAVGSPLERLIERWVARACYHARVRPVDDGFVADVVGLDGAWAEGETPEQALGDLPGVLTDWVTLKLRDGDKDIPPMEGEQLVVTE